jgi:FkbM family methyltransferase
MNDLYDVQTIEVMKRVLKRDSNCVDVGCHKGDILKAILQVAPGGTHYAFEPVPTLFDTLTVEFPSVRVSNVALSNMEGEASFQHVTSNPGYSGLKRRRYDREGETVLHIIVKTAPLDSILPANFRLDFLKIDVEGAELQVLQGALKTILRSRPLIIFEHGLGAADYYGARPESVFDLLNTQCELAIFVMKSWLQGGKPLTRVEFVRQFDTGENYYFMAHCERPTSTHRR